MSGDIVSQPGPQPVLGRWGKYSPHRWELWGRAYHVSGSWLGHSSMTAVQGNRAKAEPRVQLNWGGKIQSLELWKPLECSEQCATRKGTRLRGMLYVYMGFAVDLGLRTSLACASWDNVGLNRGQLAYDWRLDLEIEQVYRMLEVWPRQNRQKLSSPGVHLRLQ